MTDWTYTLIGPDATVRRAVATIDQAALQIALVVNADRRLLGTVTDGDVRRGILHGVGLDESVTRVMNASPTTADEHDDPEAILAMMRGRRLHQVPRLDGAGRVVGLEVLDDLLRPAERPNAVVLMAGGLGSRLGALTDDCPKPLLRVGPKPILETILEGFLAHGFRRFFVSVNYLGEQIERHFGDGSRWGAEIVYLREDRRLGTAGALSLLPERPAEPLFVMNGDLLTQLNFSHLLDFHTEHGATATMGVRDYEVQVPYGVVDTDGHRVLGLREKPTERYLVNAGVYVLSPEALGLIPERSFFNMTDLFEQLIGRGKETAVFPIREYWMDIGHPEDFTVANGHFDEVFQA